MKNNLIKGLTVLFLGICLLAFRNLETKKNQPGWKVLFDGKSLKGWKGFNKEGVPATWSVVNGVLEMNPKMDENGKPMEGGDLVTVEDYKDFELELDWKISKNGNSGIMFNVLEGSQYNAPYVTGPEIQILDNDGHPDGKITKHRAGDLYDLIKCSKETVKAVGEWNHVRIISDKGHLKLYLNGNLSVETQMHDAAWDALVAGSKFHSMPDFGKSDHGKICLQDHGNKVSFKNIRIKVLGS